MDRQIVYIGQIPQDTDQLQQNKNVMIGLGYALQAILGSSTVVDGLACTPNSPAAMNVLVAPGSIYGLQNVDGTAYGSLASDTSDQIVKQGIIMSTTTLSCPAPATTGQSVVYLVQVAYQDTDAGATVLPYYNAANPSVAWSGPSNSGVSQNTIRKGVCTVSVKTGVAATTGTQTTPSPDAGFTGLYAITVANGATTITSGNIQTLATAPFIGTKLPAILSAIQADSASYAADTSVSANTITVALSPIPQALTNGMPIRVKVANSSTGATVMNVNGLGNVSCTTTSGSAFATNTVVANGIYTFIYDANGTRWQLQGFTAASGTGLLPANNLSDVSNAATSLSNLGGAPKASPALTGMPTAPTAPFGTDTTQIATTAFVKNALSTPTIYQATPSDPTGTLSATPVMMGLDGSITPNFSGDVMVIISGDIQTNGGSGISSVQLSYGTGSAPGNGSSLTGTQVGGKQKYGLASEGSAACPFSVSAIVSGLTVGTAYWLDLAVSNNSGDIASLKDLSISAYEIK